MIVLPTLLVLLPAGRYASVGLCDSNIVCPSVCLPRAGIVSTSGNTTILVSWCQISSQNSKGFPEWGLKEGLGGKIQRFSSFNVNISKTVADRAKVTINVD